MKITVIGSTRGIGLKVVEQAVEKGHSVTALVRNPASLFFRHKNLHIIQGDVLAPHTISGALGGQDVIVFTVGIMPTRAPVKVFSEGTKNVLDAMQETGAKFLIAVTGMGAGDSKGHWGFAYRFIYTLVSIKTIYEDKDRQEQLIKESDIEWIIVRPAFLTEGPITGRYRILTDMKTIRPGSISRADVAHFILNQVSDPSFLRQAPILMY
ncbi:MAG: SDR family oxidoreductase [Nitrospiraceae bacterium]|nr:MAG: SDR family oxidoreductase [Nitrospiraceae bacterium]